MRKSEAANDNCLPLAPDATRPPCAGAGTPPCAAGGPSRRAFLAVAGSSAGAILLGGAVAGCMDTGSPPSGPVMAGNVSALSVGTLLVMSNVIVARDGDGVYAMSAICTHAGCFLEDGSKAVSDGLHCPCHGSAFDGNGAVTHGPAGQALQHYAVTIAADGSITVDGSQKVDASVRTSA